MNQPLNGLVVVELATGVAGPYAGKLLADFGADVIKIEPPEGDWARREGPRTGERPDPERSPLFLHLNSNKRSVVADLGATDGVELVRALAAGADAIIESHRPGELEQLGLGPDHLRELRPELVVTSVTPFGRNGPYARLEGSEILAYAMGGPMSATGDPDREPLKLAGNIVQYHCGSVAALATLAATAMAEASGRGTHVDVSNFETQASSIDRRATLAIGHQFDGAVGYRPGGGRAGPIPAGVYPTVDGYAQLLFAPNWMPRVAEMLGDDELARRFAGPDWYDDEEIPDLLDAAVFTWTLERTKQQAMEEAQARQLPITPLNDTTEVLADRHFRQREFWQRWDHPAAGTYEAPGPQFRMADGWKARRPAPLLGEHTDEVTAAPPRPRIGANGVARVPTEPTLPLAGIRVLDLTVVWAGPLATMLLGDLGAEVIRLDNPNLFPTATRGAVPRPAPGHETDFGQFWGRYPGGWGGARPWNRVAGFVCHARNKMGATLDLRSPLGRETFLELVEQADVVVENNSARVLPSLDLDWDVLQARNRRLIALRMPSLGLTGPYAGYIGFGAHIEALCGLSSLRGYPDLDPTSLDTTYYMDPASGVSAAFAVLCALRRRHHTGRGELIEMAQAENLLNYIGEYIVDASLTGEPHAVHGNRHPHRAPQGAYRCDGDDEWMVLSVADDAQWFALCRALGWLDWVDEPDLAIESGRRVRQEEIDDRLNDWTSRRPVGEAVAVCRSAGLSAGPVLDEAGLFNDPQLAVRNWFRHNRSADVPDIRCTAHQWQWDGPPMRWGRFNMMGRDNEIVYRGLLGKSDEEMQALRADGHLTDGYRDPDGNPL